ncbi:tetratricopeptide repeat protein [Dactylosporangium siamense]|uniref:HTH cro/C1-type domain-containing protein n=1 Tax=Dactylosporangium siamense TaxID=685454 RepID=A0A919Q173_9ACTN|nr:helix-turn-helix domain-containing protein [Dactylosporangium siamense]GIG52025.1 hypothetical protein Dsi01nite_100660 [Dactylosporangium siamense]
MPDGPAGAAHIGGIVRRLRERALLTQEELAGRSGLSVGTIRGIEAGRIRRPHQGSVRLLVAALEPDGPEQDMLLVALSAGTPAADGSPMAPPAAPPLPARPVPAQLPAAPAAFTGRGDTLARLDALLAPEADRPDPVAVPVVAVVGAAGIGKTALALHWTHRVKGAFPDGQLHLNLRGFDPGAAPLSPEAALRACFDALDVPPARVPATIDGQSGLLRSLLAERRMLLVLDNARDAGQVRPLLPGSPGCLVVVTSRVRLTGLAATDSATVLTLDLFTDDEARRLLTGHLGADRVAAEPDAVTGIVDACAGLPLALTIVAARAAAGPPFPLGVLAGQLRNIRDQLDVFEDDDAAGDLRAVMSWSVRTLDDETGRLFRLLGLHPGPDVDPAAAAALAGLPRPAAARALARLARVHLVVEERPGRYSFHDLVRAYAAELAGTHESAGAGRAAVERLYDHLMHHAHAAALLLRPERRPGLPLPVPSGPPSFADQAAAAEWFDGELQVLLTAVAAQSRATGSALDGAVWRIAWAVQDVLDRGGWWAELAAVQHAGLVCATRLGDLLGQLHTRRALALVGFRLGRGREAAEHLGHALHCAEALGDVPSQAQVTYNIALLLLRQDQLDAALAAAERADLLYAAGEPVHRWRAWQVVAQCHTARGEHQEALAACRRALLFVRASPDPASQAFVWDTLADAHHRLGRLRLAAAYKRRASARFEAAGDAYHLSQILLDLGDIERDAGDHDGAREQWEASLAILERLEHPDAELPRARLAAAKLTVG